MHFRLFWLGLCPWDKKPQNRLFFFYHSKCQRRAFALELRQSSPNNVLQARSSPQHDSSPITNFLKWPCVGTVARQEQLLLAPPDGQGALSTLHSPALHSLGCHYVRVGGEGSCPLTADLVRYPRSRPKTGIWPRAIKWLDQMGNALFQDEYLLFSTRQSSIASFFFPVFMWDVSYQGS